MEWHSDIRDNGVVVAPHGAIDHDSADAFQERLMPAIEEAAGAGGRLVVDLAGVDYMSSVGLRVLMRAANQARGASVVIAVTNLNETMREIFQISRFDKMFPIHDSIDQALAG